ncbi:subunit 17 of mediator complex-domain-containing protein [Desarmillaria tabescens]|uniref:Mediator of RNA polymerase II transcription subunit 17 n=1 Tax=Armillaria tabescens TaxID=1929756 RepID=A0AA39NN06_ARMTA|nr:subunit 17 of mediator complex-domain-containing protein [Desarmillaria tabescens]KAK0468484.1 subunit 17 of mediator complex-domain-containing protein [Desarmillaria tabescens]
MEPPSWKSLKLSLERPYKDENGAPIPVLQDITPQGEQIYEPKQTPSQILGENLRRIFLERGVDFFEKTKDGNLADRIAEAHVDVKDTTLDTAESDDDNDGPSIMTSEELYKMRMEISSQLFIALGEMTHARDLLSAILSTPGQAPHSIPGIPRPEIQQDAPLSATIIKKPPPIVSVQAFNTQLAIGSKDEALRKASDVFKAAADRLEGGRLRGEKYWADALKIRRGNWALTPAPLPLGSATGKGADKSSKDFLISYGLEESSSSFRRRAIGHMASVENASEELIFPFRQRTSLRVSLTSGEGHTSTFSKNDFRSEDTSLDNLLRDAQREIVEQEIFSLLVHEASRLPTASAKVSERLIVIDSALGTELKFELVESDSVTPLASRNTLQEATCDLIYHSLHALLLRRHQYLKSQRLSGSDAPKTDPPPVLQPIIDLLQYQVFCHRVKTVIEGIVTALTLADITSTLRFQPVGEVGHELVNLLDNRNAKAVGGQCILRIDRRHTVRFSFLAPSTLNAHLAQATLTISSIPQLNQLLTDDVGRFLLQRICELGREISSNVSGIWFLDLNRCVGRWEGCTLNFRIDFHANSTLRCTLFRLDRHTPKQGESEVYHSGRNVSLIPWVEGHIRKALGVP